MYAEIPLTNRVLVIFEFRVSSQDFLVSSEDFLSIE